ncbi:MAG: hypothetical protein R2855_18000 [Thermomicrobiales bacterium]
MVVTASPVELSPSDRCWPIPRQLEVLRIIRDHGVITQRNGSLLHTSASQVSRLTAPLIARSIVTVEPRLPLVEGRPTELLALAEDTHFVWSGRWRSAQEASTSLSGPGWFHAGMLTGSLPEPGRKSSNGWPI